MDPVSIAVAFVLGFAGRLIGLPPLVGFLAAGFALKAAGVEGGAALDRIADLGVYLLLFGIGLKLKLKSLVRPEICGVATVHMFATTVVFAVVLVGLSVTGAGLVGGLDLGGAALVAFALSFSSTVFAVKVLEESGESGALHGRIAIGILIVQDLFAIVFLTISLGTVPSVWALALLALPLVRVPLFWIMSRSGHGELLVLYGVLLVFASTWLFTVVGLKADLGALVAGVLVGSHPKANELSRTLMGFKDLFLVGFFLNIGLKGAPSLEAVGIAVALALVMPLKVALFFILMTRFRLRARTSFLGSLSLANYSEFGLIVGAVGATSGWITDDWLLIVAVALSLTFVAAAPLAARAPFLYERLESRLRRHEGPTRLPGDEMIDPGDAKVAIFGMGRVGTGAYDEIRDRLGDVVTGLDRDPEVARRHGDAGRRVGVGDGTDTDFYQKVRWDGHGVRVIMLAMSNPREKLVCASLLRAHGYTGAIAATALHADQIRELESAGVDAAFDLLAEAGAGFADHVCIRIEPARDDEAR